MSKMSDLLCSLCNFKAGSEQLLNEHIMDCHNDIILKKETEAAKESLECLVEIKQEVEDPLSVNSDDAQPMEVRDDDEMKAENSDDSKPLKSRGKKSDQLMKLKKSRVFERRSTTRVRKRPELLVVASTPKARTQARAPAASKTKKKSSVRMFHCEICDYKVNNRASLQRHVKSAHSKDLKFLCTACGKRFSDHNDLSNHIEKNNITTSDGVWQMACSKFRKVPSEAGEHLFADEDTGEVNCLKCDYSSTDQKTVKRHIERVHFKLFNRFICNACSQSFSSKEVLAVHLKEDHRDFSLVEKFSIPEETVCEDLDERPKSPMFECKDCAYTTKVRRNLYRHVISVHTKDKRFSCEDCGSRFAEHHELMYHVEVNAYTNEKGRRAMKCTEKASAQARVIKSEDSSTFNCTACSFTSPSESAAKKHIVRVHVKPKEQNRYSEYPVDNYNDDLSNDYEPMDDFDEADDFDDTGDYGGTGDYEMGEDYDLSNDYSTRSSDNDDDDDDGSDPTYNARRRSSEIVIQCCQICDYKSDSQRNLTRHVRSAHSKQKEFLCSHCGKKFASKRVLNQHLARTCRPSKREPKFQQTPANPADNISKDEESGDYKCRQCPFTSPDQSAVLSHIEKIHVKMVCNICSAEIAADDDPSDHICDDNGDQGSGNEGGSKLYTCDECSYQSSFRNNVDKHMRSVHRKERNYLCSECGSMFSEQKSLTYHLEKMKIIRDDGSVVFRCAKFTKLPSMAGEHVHKDDEANMFLCRICDYTSQSLTDTKRHIQRIHLGEKRYICNTCNRGFTSQPEVGRHLARDHNDTSFLGDSIDIGSLKPETYKCQQCTYESPSRINVERHFSVVHLKERNFQCTECGQRYSDKKTLLMHVEKNQVAMPDGKTVLQCTKFTKLPSRAGEHLRKDEQTNLYHCVLCNYSSKNQSGAKRHVERMHLKEKRFVCNTCSRDFNSKRELAYHLGMEHNDLSLCENGANLLSLKPEALQCEYCEYSSTVRQYLERHVKAVHLKERNFVCSECGFAFSEKKSLQGHIDRNTITGSDGEASLQCSKYKKLPSSASEHIAKNNESNEFYCLQCSYRSKCPSDTKRHVERMHLKLKKFVCKLCDKGFSSKPNFYLHLATDHGDNSLIVHRPNIAKRLELHHCQYCSYTTKYPKDIQRHFNSIHNKERQSFFCDRCDKKFADKRGLMRHLRANH